MKKFYQKPELKVLNMMSETMIAASDDDNTVKEVNGGDTGISLGGAGGGTPDTGGTPRANFSVWDEE